MTDSRVWKAGAATATFAVPAGTPMAGFVAREGGADGTLDQLTVSCLALEAQGERFALVAIDLIGVDRELVQEIASRTGLPETSLALSASHTHSGPAGILKRLHPADADQVDSALREAMIESTVRVVNDARDSLADASLIFGQARAEGVSANRNAPDGPFDPTVSLISVRSTIGRPIATVVHFACHPTILPATSNLISADFPGAVRNNLPPDEFGVVLYVNGAAGDISTRFTRQSQDTTEVQRVGSVIANAVKGADVTLALTPRIESVCEPGSIKLRSQLNIESAFEAGVAAELRMKQDNLSPAERRIEETRLQGVEILRRISSRIEDMPDEIDVCLWTLGELTLIGFPGELFASLGAALTRSGTPTLLLGYTNGYNGYFPDRDAYDAGTYEALASPYAPGASEELVTWLRSQL